jgi:opacity protein-like surface antigen
LSALSIVLDRLRRYAAASERTDETMSSTRLLAAAGAAVLLATPAAYAADLGPPPPSCSAMPSAPGCSTPSVDTSGWYLRGYVGMTNQNVDTAGFKPNPFPNDSISTAFMNFDSSPLFGGGIGYQVNSWLRFEGTAEYRSSAHFHGQQVDRSVTPVQFADDYNASKSELLFLANGFVDIGTWWNVTPFVGAGVGMSRNTITGFTDIGNSIGDGISSTTYADDHSKWSFAYAFYAGLSYQVTPTFSVDMTYRYLNLGSAQTGAPHAFDGSTIPTNPFVFDNLTSNDVMLGMRWMLDTPPPPPPPLMRRG